MADADENDNGLACGRRIRLTDGSNSTGEIVDDYGDLAGTEVVIDAATGAVLRQYPAAVFGGAVTASAATTVVVGPASVTSYDNANGRVRWRRPVGVGQTWRADGDILYVAESAGGYLGSAPVTSLRVDGWAPSGISISTAASGDVLYRPPFERYAKDTSGAGRSWRHPERSRSVAIYEALERRWPQLAGPTKPGPCSGGRRCCPTWPGGIRAR